MAEAVFEVLGENDIVCVLDNVKASFEWIGEGVCGDYNPDDPNDVPFLRYDVAELAEDEWGHMFSFCTQFPTTATLEEKKQALKLIAERVKTAVDQSSGVKSECERLSWISPDWLKKAA